MSSQLDFAETQYLSVTDLNKCINSVLEQGFPRIQFEGEVSTISRPASGHIYLSLKDKSSNIPAVIWRGTASSLSFKIEQGMQLYCVGRPNIYHVTGRFQMILTKVVPAGDGLLQQKFLELKAKLEKEGHFDESRKRPLPFLPKSIGVVTSGTGAAIDDITSTIKRRFPSIPVSLIPVRVQGDEAAPEIVAAIKKFNELKNVDMLIVGRGGGSLQDLWAFNEESVVRAVFASSIPIISAVGHEVDISLCDLAADLRAATPTAAAELATPDRKELEQRIIDLSSRISDYSRWLEPLVQRIDSAAMRLKSQASSQLKMKSQEIDSLHDVFTRSLKHQIQTKQQYVESLAARVQASSHLSVLKRGFAIVRKADAVVSGVDAVKKQDALDIQFYNGSVHTKVETVNKNLKK